DEHDRQSRLARQRFHRSRHISAHARRDGFPVDDASAHGDSFNLSRNAAISASLNPSISIVLRRAVVPRATCTLDFGTPSALANSFSSAAFASPFSGAARTRALR